VTANRLPDSVADRPLASFIDATQGTARELLDLGEPDTAYMALARLSGHLAVMCRTVYPHANGHLGGNGQLRTVCLGRAREAEWTLRLFECHLSGCVTAARLPTTGVLTLLAQRLDSYRAAEQALVIWLEDQLADEGREKLARAYRRALTRAPTRPHPRRLRAGPLRHVAFWLHGSWDRVLDTMDSRPGVGRDFLAPSPGGAPSAGVV